MYTSHTTYHSNAHACTRTLSFYVAAHFAKFKGNHLAVLLRSFDYLFTFLQLLLQILEMTSGTTNVSSSEKIIMIQLVIRIIQRFSIEEAFVSRYERVVSIPKALSEPSTPAHLIDQNYKIEVIWEVTREVSSV